MRMRSISRDCPENQPAGLHLASRDSKLSHEIKASGQPVQDWRPNPEIAQHQATRIVCVLLTPNAITQLWLSFTFQLIYFYIHLLRVPERAHTTNGETCNYLLSDEFSGRAFIKSVSCLLVRYFFVQTTPMCLLKFF